MNVHVRIPPSLRSLTDGSDEVSVQGDDVRAVVDALEAAHPGLRERICAEDGSVLRFVNLFVGEDDIRWLDGLDTSLKDGDRVSILPAIAGGL